MRTLCVFPLLFLAGVLGSNVYHEPERLLGSYFPQARVVRVSVYLSEKEHAQMTRTLGFAPSNRLYSLYEARKAGQMVGYGFFDTRNVRTKDETLFIAFDAQGVVQGVEVVSFFEPEDYLPPGRWLSLFKGKDNGTPLIPGRDLPGISGATLTARAVSHSVRLGLALYDLHRDDP